MQAQPDLGPWAVYNIEPIETPSRSEKPDAQSFAQFVDYY